MENKEKFDKFRILKRFLRFFSFNNMYNARGYFMEKSFYHNNKKMHFKTNT